MARSKTDLEMNHRENPEHQNQNVPAPESDGGERRSVIIMNADPADQNPRRELRRRRRGELALAWGVPILLIALWQIASDGGHVDVRFFPSPTNVIRAGVDAHGDGVLWANTWITIKRILIGYGFGVATGLIAGLAMGLSRLMRAAFDPLLSALYTVPKLALLPMFLLIFGIGEKPRIVVIGVTVFFFIWISTMDAVMSVEPGSKEALTSFGANRWQMIRHVIIPAILPTVFVAMRVASGVAVLVTVGLEFVQADDGIGAVTWKSWSLFLAARMYVGIVVIALVGLAFSIVITGIGRICTPWAPRQKVVGR